MSISQQPLANEHLKRKTLLIKTMQKDWMGAWMAGWKDDWVGEILVNRKAGLETESELEGKKYKFCL